MLREYMNLSNTSMHTIRNINNKLNSYKPEKLIFLTVFLCGLLCFWLACISGFQHPDGINEGLFEYKSIDWEISCGRWMIPILNALTRNIVIPPLYVAIYLAFIALSLIMLSRHLGITNNLFLITLACLMTANPNVIGHLQFMFTTQIYSFALLTSTIFIVLVPQKKLYKNSLAVLCMAISMGCYQSYIGYAAAGCALTLMISLIDGEEIKTIVANAVRYVLCAGMGATIYMLCLRIAMAIRDIDYASTRMANGTGITKEQLIKATRRCYRLTWEYFADKTLDRFYLNGVSAVILLGLAVYVLIMIYKRSDKSITDRLFRIFACVILIITYPIACFVFHLITPGEGVHELMMYQLVFFYVMAFALAGKVTTLTSGDIMGDGKSDHPVAGKSTLIDASNSEKSIANTGKIINASNPGKYIASNGASIIITAALLLSTWGIVWTYFIASNATFRCYQLDYQNAISKTQIVMSQIYQMEGYTPDTKMVIVGEPDNSDLENYYQMYRYAVLTGSGRIIYHGMHGQLHHWPQFIRTSIGTEVQWVSEEEYLSVIDNHEFEEMSLWPSSGSIKKIDGIIVVKMTADPIR